MSDLDVNEAFAVERREQAEAARNWEQRLQERVAAGTVLRLPDGRYKVLTGLDKGEILSARGEPQHGLDESTGAVALYTAVPAWHHLGQVIPGGATSVEDVLQLGRIGYDVLTVPAVYPWKGEHRTHLGKHHTVRSDTGAALGIVGPDYHVIQPREGFAFLQDLVDDHRVTWESAGALRGGAKVFVTMRMPEDITVDPGGINDTVVPFIEVINSYDGHTPFEVVTTPWRTVCANTERFSVRDAKSRWKVRHTRNATSRIHEARRTLGLSHAYYQQWSAEETALTRTDLAIDEYDALIDDLWPIEPDATARTRRTARARRDRLHDLLDTEAGRTGRTAYAAERAVTDYTDHFADVRPSAASGLKGNKAGARGLRLLEGTDDDLKSRAHRHLMLLRRT